MSARGRKADLLAQVRSIQNAYPQIYLACHVDHIRRRGHAAQLTSADGSILAHLSFDPAATTGALARHLGIAPSSLSARIKQLVASGHVARVPAADDRRVVRLELTRRGLEATSAASVLDAVRVGRLLERLSDADRTLAVRGLALLAAAAAGTSRARQSDTANSTSQS